MSRNQRRSRTALIVLSTGLIIATVGVPASAALTGGHFFIHAQNIEDPTIEATAGLGGLGGNPGGGDGGSNPGDGGENAGAVTFNGGPLSTTITEDMLAFSEANRKAQEEGRLGDIKTDPDGWQTIWSYDTKTQKLVPGIVGAEGDLALTVLSKHSVVPSINDAAGFGADDIVYQFYRMGRQSDYVITDYRIKPKDGAVFSYRTNGAFGDDPTRDYYAETRYVSEGGKLIAVTVAKQTDGRMTIQRASNPRVFTSYPESPNKPYSLSLRDGKPDDMSILLPDSSAGYNQIQIQAVDGGTQVHYRNYVGQTAEGQDNFGPAPTSGPNIVALDETGKIFAINYTKADGETGYLTDYPTVADYNRVTGQNWDGKYAKFSDFDLSFPFQVTKP